MKKKRNILIIAICLGLVLFAGCKKETKNIIVSEPAPVKIATLSGPTGMGMAPMITNAITSDLYKGSFTLATSPDQIVGGMINGEYQIASVPTNLAATLYNKTEGKIILGGVNTLGTLSIVTSGEESVESIADLKGKNIIATGQGATPEYVLTYLLEANGMKIGEDVNVTWIMEHSEAAAKMSEGDASIALLPEPFATITLAKNPTLKKAVDVTKSWEESTGSKLMMGCIVVNKEWAEKNQSVLAAFLEDYKKSVDGIVKADAAAGKAVVDAKIMENAELAKKAIPNCNIVLETPVNATQDLMVYYEALFKANPKSIGGKLPSGDFYGLTY